MKIIKKDQKKIMEMSVARKKIKKENFFGKIDNIDKEDVKKFIVLLITGLIIFFFYLNFITYKGKFQGEHILYVKIDGKTGAVLKIDNRYLKKQIFIRNVKNLEYGTYLVRFEIMQVNEKNGFTTLEGKIIGYRESKLNPIRKYILDIFDRLFITEDNLYAFSKASILGEKADVSKEMNDRFKYTGLAHLIVISGTHISLVIMGMIKFLDKINLGYRLKYISAFIILTLYCMLVGMSPGIMRAYIMGAMMIIARLLFEKEDSAKSLIISFVIIVILNPYSVYDISMQLSYAAVIAIIFVYPPVEKMLEDRYFYKMKNGIVKDTLKLVLLSFVIQLTSIPLFLYYFEKLPLFSFLLNIVGIPLGTVLIELFFAAILLNILKIELFNGILVFITEIIYNAFEGFIFMGSKIPLMQINVNGKINITYVIVYYAVLLIFIKILSRKN